MATRQAKPKTKAGSQAQASKHTPSKQGESRKAADGRATADHAGAASKGATGPKAKKPSGKAAADVKTVQPKAKSARKTSGGDGRAARDGAAANGHAPAPAAKPKRPRAKKAEAPRPAGDGAPEAVSALLQAIESFVREYHLGHVVRDAQFDWGEVESPDLRPALAYVSFARWAEYRTVPTNLTWHVVPDLVVEVQQERRPSAALKAKIKDYLAAGVRRVWVVVPSKRELHDYDSAAEPRILKRPDDVRREDFLFEFRRALGAPEPAQQ